MSDDIQNEPDAISIASNESNNENVVVDVPMKMLNIKESSKVSKTDDIESNSAVLSKRVVELESTIKQLEELENKNDQK